MPHRVSEERRVDHQGSGTEAGDEHRRVEREDAEGDGDGGHEVEQDDLLSHTLILRVLPQPWAVISVTSAMTIVASIKRLRRRSLRLVAIRHKSD